VSVTGAAADAGWRGRDSGRGEEGEGWEVREGSEGRGESEEGEEGGEGGVGLRTAGEKWGGRTKCRRSESRVSPTGQ